MLVLIHATGKIYWVIKNKGLITSLLTWCHFVQKKNKVAGPQKIIQNTKIVSKVSYVFQIYQTNDQKF